MQNLLNITIANAITVIPLALIAGLIAWRIRWAPLHHAVWVLVLLKFITPPLFSLPVDLAVLPSRAPIPTAVVKAPSQRTLPARATPTASHAVLTSNEVRCDVAQVAPTAVEKTTCIKAGALSGWWQTLSWSSLLLITWLTGSVCWLVIQLSRAIRFEALISYRGNCPEELQSECTELAQQSGILRAPRVCVIDAPISPMLWGMGSRAKLLFPANLASRMNPESRSTLLMHELAHYRRGDHLVRLLELFTTGLFWWHPVLWIARRQIEQAEEECCDAWVVEQFPKAPRRYAEALLDTIDFLCESRRALPPLASGLGQAPFLRRRLTQIMAGTTIPPLSRPLRCGLLLVAGLLLPIQPFVLRAASGNRPTDRLPDVLVTTIPGKLDAVPEISINEDTTQQDVEPIVNPLPAPPPVQRRPPRTPHSRKNGEIWSTAVSSDGRFVIRIYTTRRVTLTDLRNNSVSELPSSSLTAVAFSPEGHTFYTAGSDGRVLRWNAVRGAVDSILLDQGAVLNTIAISPEGSRIAVGGRDGHVTIVAADGAATPQSWTAPSAVNCIRFSPGGRNLAAGCGDWKTTTTGHVVLFDAETGNVVQQRRTMATGAIAFASDDELILGGWAGKVQLWNLASDEIVAEGMVDKSVVAAAAFSPDNPALREAALLPMVISSEPASAFTFLQDLLDPVP